MAALEQVIHPEQLVRIGFVYTGEGSLVQCFQCGVRYRNWLKGDIPISVHQRCNPHCAFQTLSCKSKPSQSQIAHPLNLPSLSECIVDSLHWQRQDGNKSTVVNLSIQPRESKLRHPSQAVLNRLVIMSNPCTLTLLHHGMDRLYLLIGLWLEWNIL